MGKFISIILLIIINFTSAYGQSLWIYSYSEFINNGYSIKEKKDCNNIFLFQNADTLFIYNSSKEEWNGSYHRNIVFTIRADSIFKKPLSIAEQYTLSNNPELLPDSIKGEVFIGLLKSDSLLINHSLVFSSANKGYWHIFKKASNTIFSKNNIDELSVQLTNYSFQIDLADLSERENSKIVTVEYPLKSKPSYFGDPFPKVRGIYNISEHYFLFIPKSGEKLFQIIKLEKEGLIVESMCGERKKVKILRIEKSKSD